MLIAFPEITVAEILCFNKQPQVDACGNQNCNSLVTGVRVQPGEATIMSYCHSCGGSRNLGFTFGGHWNGGDRTDINTWSGKFDNGSLML